ncbi:hypothetical protein Syun_001818 [Stephania yunnanensis]|uniref:Uncharacterized protein n=1 Tax=Stephania yunnanensis TaxID=152371 RepID=A0AAP0LEH1_9MAGN
MRITYDIDHAVFSKRVNPASVPNGYPYLEQRQQLKGRKPRLEAAAKAAEAEDNGCLSQTLSQMTVLEAHYNLQVSCFRAEQTQFNWSLEKERQHTSKDKQEYLEA